MIDSQQIPRKRERCRSHDAFDGIYGTYAQKTQQLGIGHPPIRRAPEARCVDGNGCNGRVTCGERGGEAGKGTRGGGSGRGDSTDGNPNKNSRSWEAWESCVVVPKSKNKNKVNYSLRFPFWRVVRLVCA